MEPNPVSPTLFHPQLLVDHPETKEKALLRLISVAIEVKVLGTLASTTLDLTFFNDHPEDLEGELILPLHEGQTVTRYALDINGKMREGVVVGKEKARKVFEEIVRRNVDPGLVEKVQGNLFKTRVYPLPAKGSRRVRIGFEHSLTHTPEGLLYELPLQFEEALDRFQLRVDVFNADQAPTVAGPNWASLDFAAEEGTFFAERDFANYTANQPLQVLMPKDPTTPEVSIETGADGHTYFHIHCLPERFSVPRKTPTHIGLYWDVSSSAKSRNFAREYELLNDWFQEIENLQLDLIPFGHQLHPATTFHIHGGDWSALKQHLETLVYDGGTQLGALDLRSYAGDEIMIFTDGLQNYGNQTIQEGPAPILVVNSATTAHHAHLRGIAEANGGHYLNLARMTIEDAIGRLRNLPYRFLMAEVVHAEALYPSKPMAIDKTFSLSGRLTADEQQIRLYFGMEDTALWSTAYTLRMPTHPEKGSGLVQKMWAGMKLAELESVPEPSREDIIAHAKTHSLVTDYTSLLVLEEVTDYVTHEIEPPAELKAEYDRLRIEQRATQEITAAEHLKKVVGYFDELKGWWNTEFPKPEAPEKAKLQDESVQNQIREGLLRLDQIGGTTRQRLRRVAPSSPAQEEPMAELREYGETTMDAMPMEENMFMMGEIPLKEEAKTAGKPAATISIKNWDPNEPYLKTLEAAEDPYASYLELRDTYAQSPAFFLDVANFFLDRGDDRGIRILSNIAELKLGSERLLRLLGYKLSQLGHHGQALSTFEQVTRLKPEEPQSWRDYARSLAENGEAQAALEHYYKVATSKWDNRFPEIELIALEEMNAFISTHKDSLDLSAIDPGLMEALPVDLRVELSWDADNCDLDLWVTDPDGEKCNYENRQTRLGGRISQDFTQGYGPEVFMLKNAPKGTYKVEVNYYSDSQQNLAGPTTLIVRFYTQFGREEEQLQEVIVRVKEAKEVIHVGDFEVT